MPTQLEPEFFRRLDDSDDEAFYLAPRFVVHIDEAAIRTVGEIYLSRLPRGGAILDLMSSWRSHLPPELKPTRVVGLGLNRLEMEDNPALTEIVTHNLNRRVQLPFDDASFYGAVLSVSVQYLIHPVEVFAEVGRVLRPGAPFIVTFSNRMFPTKAVAIWVNASEEQRVDLVGYYFTHSAAFEKMEMIDRSSGETDPLWAVLGYRKEQ
ncbi:MAG TPA: methyltransferase domain-containing protein [Candidatus Binataceae bacterium]|jgi:SAM-dependent methyltransferase|nr:methyltransferase domain-containing protein [Candidatus Binataceae bacterium]